MTQEITITYKINKNEESIKIFGSSFVKNNESSCKIIHNNKELELTKSFDVPKDSDQLVIKLKGIDKITNFSNMFSGCSALLSLSGISDIDTYILTTVRYNLLLI